MENNMPGYGGFGGGQDALWLWALFGGGYGGFGGRRGRGFDEGGACCPPATLENLTNAQTALTEAISASEVNSNNHFLDAAQAASSNALRNETGQMGIQASIAAANAQNLIGQKDLTAAVAACCCDLRVGQQGIVNAIDKCCCETQNAIEHQTNHLERAICNDGQATRALITDNRMADLQSQLGICRDENSNLRQTVVLSEKIAAACNGNGWPYATAAAAPKK